MKKYFLHVTLLAALLGGCSHYPANAADMGAAAKAAPLQQSYTWYDGKRAMTVWLDPQLLAEFSVGKNAAAEEKNAAQDAGSAASGPTVKSVYPDATPQGAIKGGVQLWRMGAGVTSDKAAKALSVAPAAAMGTTGTVAATGAFSPVLRDGASASARMRALPGNIIVYLNPAWDAAQVQAWAQRGQLTILKKLEIGSNIYVIKTAPGMEALTLANAIYQSGQVVAAFPDWWQDVVAK